MVKQLAKALIGRIVTDYRINWIYAADTPAPLLVLAGESVIPTDDAARAALEASTTHKMRNSLSFERAGLTGLVLVRDGMPLCVAHFAPLGLYDRAGTWPLREDEMALMDIATEETARGQGLAPRVIAAATRHFINANARRLIAFIWWSNKPSVRAFTKAGWRRIGLSLEWQVAGKWYNKRFTISI